MKVFVLAASVILSQLLATSAESAVLRVATSEAEFELGCTHVLQGSIQSDDLEVLEAIFRENLRTVLCLDSNGGSFITAIEISEMIISNSYSVATAVPLEASCTSACAIVFLFGQSIAFQGGSMEHPVPDRRLHVGAVLGLHSPYLDPSIVNDNDGQLYSAEQVGLAYTYALQVVALLNQLRELRPRSFDDILMTDMLLTPPGDMYYINTVAVASRLGIRMVGGTSEAIKEHMFENACHNALLRGTESNRIQGFLNSENLAIDTELQTITLQHFRRGFGPQDCSIRIDHQEYHGASTFPGSGPIVVTVSVGDVFVLFSPPGGAFFDPKARLASLQRDQEALLSDTEPSTVEEYFRLMVDRHN